MAESTLDECVVLKILSAIIKYFVPSIENVWGDSKGKVFLIISLLNSEIKSLLSGL